MLGRLLPLKCILFAGGLGLAASIVVAQPGRFVGTPSDPWIPNFAHPEVAGGPVVATVRSGAWFDPATWGGGIPGSGDVVVIGHDVWLGGAAEVYDVVVYPEGRLRFRPDRDTRLSLGTLQVLDGGTLEIGRRDQSVEADVVAEVVFVDRTIDTRVDPGQYGNGLVALGSVTLHGSPRSTNFVRLAAEPRAGETALALAEPVSGWSPGGVVVLPDTRQTDPRTDRGFVPQTERLEIAAISPDRTALALADALAFDHPGARDAEGTLDLLGHVAYLSGNVVLRSANPSGTRGHAQFLYRADIDVRYVLFQDLGRTTAEELDPTLFDDAGNATHVGTNQPGRYPLHAHHLNGPDLPPESGYQFAFVGNAIDGGLGEHPFKWGIAVHASHYGLVRGNSVLNYAGSGLVTEDGSESFNVFDHNFVARCSSYGSLDTQDRGTAGTAFWFRGQNNYVRDNVAADSRSSGFSINAYRLAEVEIPVAPGSLERQQVDMNALPILEFAGNESYGPAFHGLDLWEIGSTGEDLHDVPRSVVRNQRIWHHYDRGLIVYRTHRITYDRLTIRGDIPQLDSRYVDPIGVHLSDHYRLRDHVITRADIQGQRFGIEVDLAGVPEDFVGNIFGQPAPQDELSETVIQASYLRNYVNVRQPSRRNLGSPRRTVLCDTEFGRVDIDLDGQDGPQYDLVRSYDFGLDRNVVSPNELVVFNYDRDPDLDLDLFFLEQAPDFIVPKTSDDGRRVGSPVEGLTNEENWAQFGIAIAGEITACLDRETHPGIDGFSCPLGDVAPTAPALVRADSAALCTAEARLVWSPSCDDGVVSAYVVSRDGADVGVTQSRRFTEAGLAPGSYRYRIRARDDTGQESIDSSALTVDVPAGGCPPI